MAGVLNKTNHKNKEKEQNEWKNYFLLLFSKCSEYGKNIWALGEEEGNLFQGGLLIMTISFRRGESCCLTRDLVGFWLLVHSDPTWDPNCIGSNSDSKKF